MYDADARRYNDTVTWLAEVLPGPMRSPVEYLFDGHELYAPDGSAVEPIFDNATAEAALLPDLFAFEYRRRLIEKTEYEDMITMMKSGSYNTMVVVSDFPPELENIHEDVGGYNASRKQTMLRVLTKTPKETLMMYSQTLDGSNRAALEAIYSSIGFVPKPGELLGQRMKFTADENEQEFLTDWLMGIYDRSLEAQYGGKWQAGMYSKRRQNTYDFVRQQRDLLSAYLASTGSFTGEFIDYSLAAAMKDRYCGITNAPELLFNKAGIVAHAMALNEMRDSGRRAQARGDVYSGCGSSVAALRDDLASDLLLEAGYGNKADEDKYGSLKFKCQKGHVNQRPHNKLIDKCKTCGISVKC